MVTGAPTTYAASKAALIQITPHLVARWAPTVRVNSASRGYVRTDMNAAWFSEEQNLAHVVDQTPLRRVAVPEDVVGAVLFLISQGGAYVTGHNLKADGG